jgi:hypothetical protein
MATGIVEQRPKLSDCQTKPDACSNLAGTSRNQPGFERVELIGSSQQQIQSRGLPVPSTPKTLQQA